MTPHERGETLECQKLPLWQRFGCRHKYWRIFQHYVQYFDLNGWISFRKSKFDTNYKAKAVVERVVEEAKKGKTEAKAANDREDGTQLAAMWEIQFKLNSIVILLADFHSKCLTFCLDILTIVFNENIFFQTVSYFISYHIWYLIPPQFFESKLNMVLLLQRWINDFLSVTDT